MIHNTAWFKLCAFLCCSGYHVLFSQYDLPGFKQILRGHIAPTRRYTSPSNRRTSFLPLDKPNWVATINVTKKTCAPSLLVDPCRQVRLITSTRAICTPTWLGASERSVVGKRTNVSSYICLPLISKAKCASESEADSTTILSIFHLIALQRFWDTRASLEVLIALGGEVRSDGTTT